MSVAFVCPIYDMKNHFQFGLELYISKLKFSIKEDLYYVFSNIQQKEKFASMIASTSSMKDFKFLIEPDLYSDYKSQVTVKKFYAIKELYQQYDYIVPIDSESQFIKEVDFTDVANYIWLHRTMFSANISPDGFGIMRSCYKTLGLYYDKTLRKDLDDFKYNFWFNDLPIYKSSTIEDFFKWLNRFDKDGYLNNYYCFEYYIYYAYLLLEQDIHIRKFKYTCMGGINEYLDIFPIQKQKEIINEMDLHWTSSPYAVEDRITMLFHLDRDKNNKTYGYKDMKERMRKDSIMRPIIIFKDNFSR